MITDCMNLLYNCFGQKEIKEKDTTGELCFWCGIRVGKYEKKKIIGDNFTNLDRARGNSTKICEQCAFCLKQEELRRKSWLAQDGEKIILLNREDVNKYIFVEKKVPFAFYVTNSFKKLGQTKTPLNWNSNKYIILFEEELVGVDIEKHKWLWEIVETFYSIPKQEEEKTTPKTFFTKEEIRLGNFSSFRINQFGWKEWKEGENLLSKYRPTPILNLFCFIVNQTKKGKIANE